MCRDPTRRPNGPRRSQPAQTQALVVRAVDAVEDLALVLGAEPAVERLCAYLAAVGVVVLDPGEALRLAKGEGDGLVIALAAIVLIQLFAGKQPVAVDGHRRLKALRLR